jgi:exonuclease SbcD
MLIASNAEEKEDSEVVKKLYDKFIGMFNEAVCKAHENV